MTFGSRSHITWAANLIYVFNDSEIKTAEDFSGKTIAIHDGDRKPDQMNIIYRMLDGEG